MTILNHFIVFEGMDGSGTTTQISNAFTYLTKKYPKFKFVRSAEPQANDPVVPLRKYLSDPPAFDNPVDASKFFALLFCADRLHHLTHVIGAPGCGRFVLSDRYTLSTLAYQAHQPDDENHRAWVENLVRPFPKPGLTIYLKIPVSCAMRRIRARAKRTGAKMETFETYAKLTQVYHGYEAYVAQHQFFGASPVDLVDRPGRVVTLNGEVPRSEVWDQVKDVLDRYMELWGQGEFDFSGAPEL